MVHKILFGLVNVDAQELVTIGNVNYDNRGHHYQLLQGHCRVIVRKHFFVELVIK